MKLAKQILALVAERDRYRQTADTQGTMIRKTTEELNKYKKCVEALYFQRGEGTGAIIAEHLGNNYGVNLEMREVYSAPLKQQLEVKWPIHTGRTILTGRSSSKTTNSDGEPQEQSEERMKAPPG